MEILHVSLGWVHSPLLTNVMQALARHMSLWLVLDLNFSIAHSSSSAMDAVVGAAWNTKEVWLGATVTAWACVEVIRYSFYATEQLGSTPDTLKFLRYNAFIALYPLGFVGEVCGLLLALQAYASGLCPPHFPQCASGSIGLYVAYFYLAASVPGQRSLLPARARHLSAHTTQDSSCCTATCLPRGPNRRLKKPTKPRDLARKMSSSELP
jgi:hypothetical protein